MTQQSSRPPGEHTGIMAAKDMSALFALAQTENDPNAHEELEIKYVYLYSGKTIKQ